MSFNRNPQGKNGHAPVPKANDPILSLALEKYHREGKTDNQLISERLLADHGIAMSATTVKRRRKDLKLTGSGVTTRTMPYQEKLALILFEMDQDPARGRGLDNIRNRIAFNFGVHLTRDFISDVMHTQDAEGFNLREPTAKSIPRTRKNPIGIHERWSGDGHDKLYSIGFPVWAVVDEATSKWLGAWVVPSNRLGTIIAYLFLCLIEKFGGLPLQFATDCGSETTQAFGFANALRQVFYPELNAAVLTPHSYVRSVHNISIERSWLRLRLEWGNNAVIVFRNGIDAGLYNPSDADQHELCQWLWSRLLQQELDMFVEFRNGVKMRKDKNKAGPSGCSRNDAFSLFEKYGLKNCLLPVDVSVIQEMKEELGGEALLSFVSPEFAERAEGAYQTLGVQTLSMGNVWEIFGHLMPLVFPS